MPWLELDWPLNWAALFGRECPVKVELGFGNGAFLEHHACKEAETNWVGVELSWESVTRLLRRIVQGALKNVRVLHVDARLAVERLFPASSIAELFINHPDPWPKERHKERHLVQDEFIQSVSDVLVHHGRLTIVTDHAQYAEHIKGVLQRQNRLRPALGKSFVHELPGRFRTRYELKALAQGTTIYYFIWENCATLTRPRSVEKVGDMPNVLLADPVCTDRFLVIGEPVMFRESYAGVNILVKFLRSYQHKSKGDELVETLVIEGNLSQQFGLLIARDAHGRVLVKLAGLGRPRPTIGVKRAVWYLARMLLENHSGLQVISSNVGPLPGQTGQRGQGASSGNEDSERAGKHGGRE